MGNTFHIDSHSEFIFKFTFILTNGECFYRLDWPNKVTSENGGNLSRFTQDNAAALK